MFKRQAKFRGREDKSVEDAIYEHDITSLVDTAPMDEYTNSIHSTETESSDQKKIVNQLTKFYLKSNETSEVIQDTPDELPKVEQKVSKGQLSCQICNDRREKHGNYVILGCNHIFHVICLAEQHFADIYKYPLLDEDFFQTRKCILCSKMLSNDDLLFLHSKFLNGTVDRIGHHQKSIEQLENQMKSIKLELKTCYDYKHKLEHQREKSKQIVATLMTTL